jgi:hypothetical protein
MTFDVKETKRYEQAVQSRDWQTCDLMFDEFNFLIGEIEKLEKQLADLRSSYAESVAKECKCEVNTGVNHELVDENLRLKQTLKELKGEK